MKYLIIILTFFFSQVITGIQCRAQSPGDTAYLHISGHIFDDQNFFPVSGHLVHINVDSLQYNFDLFTDPDGYYEALVMIPGGIQMVTGTIWTLDCNQSVVSESFTWNPAGSGVYQDLYICVNNIPPDSLFVTVQGYITDELNGMPVPDHQVDITIEINPAILYTASVFTDSLGHYQALFVIPEPYIQGSAIINTFDCNQVPQIQQLPWDFSNPNVWADFFICTTPAPCDAGFIWIADSTNSQTIHFMDLSTGNIDLWHWDFGDGTSADEPFITHFYPEPGTYTVCLTIFDTDQGMILCTDSVCQVIHIDSPLLAMFSSYLDTLSGQQNTHYFNDMTLEIPNEWYWDFGDGTFSTLQNPVHQFTYPGTYNVCLTVSRNNPNGIIETSYFCNDIVSPAYYSLGGAVYAGDYPLNNPYPEGDTGIAILYRVYPDQVLPSDTNVFSEYGYFWFSGIREGNHIVKIRLTSSSTHFGNYLPTYYGDELVWSNGDVLQLADSNNYFVNLHLRAIQGQGSGPGQINGFIIPAWTSGPSFQFYENISVILENVDHEPVAYTLTDEAGFFDFTGIPFGTYYLYAETAGFYGEVMVINLEPSNFVVTNLLLPITLSWLGISENRQGSFIAGEIFPNPVHSEFSMNISSPGNSRISCSVISMTGQLIEIFEFLCSQGSQKVLFQAGHLPEGAYILKLNNDSGEYLYRRFIKLNP